MYRSEDRFQDDPWMVDKTGESSADKDFVVQSNDKAIKQCLSSLMLP